MKKNESIEAIFHHFLLKASENNIPLPDSLNKKNECKVEEPIQPEVKKEEVEDVENQIKMEYQPICKFEYEE